MTEELKVRIEKEVSLKRDQLSALSNILDYKAVELWYPKEEYWGYIGNGGPIPTVKALLDSVAVSYSARINQKSEPSAINIKALSRDLAFVSFIGMVHASQKDGKFGKGHIDVTQILKKDPQGWKIMHNHEPFTEIN